MPKFSSTPRPPVAAPITTNTPVSTATPTYEGAPAATLDPKSELFLLAVTNMVSESTFYEDPSSRDARFARLVHTVTQSDPAWMREFIPWLRKSANMRSAPVVALAEYIAAGGPNGRSLIADTLSRADEPAELLAYWHQFHGRKLPAALKRGIADACTRLYTEFTALRYDGQSRGYRMGDVIELTHPKPSAPWQSQLFKYLVQRTHGDTEITLGPDLTKIADRQSLESVPAESRRDHLRSEILRSDRPFDIPSWEWLSGWIPGGMDAEAWEFAIPSMGYMALLRNLRNFDEAGISDESKDYVRAILRDPERVATSRQFPYRFYSAFKNAPSLEWGRELEKALEFSTRNIPALGGRTLVLTDTSGSMTAPVTNRSTVQRFEVAAVFAASLARACEGVDLYSWASTYTKLPFTQSTSVLRTVRTVAEHINRDGMGTELLPVLQAGYKGHERVVVFTDMQLMDGEGRFGYRGGWGAPRTSSSIRDIVPPNVPIHFFDLGGYGRVPMAANPRARVFLSGGFSDAAFRMLPLLERDAGWPWESD